MKKTIIYTLLSLLVSCTVPSSTETVYVTDTIYTTDTIYMHDSSILHLIDSTMNVRFYGNMIIHGQKNDSVEMGFDESGKPYLKILN